ncbi:hypothetical protein O9G_002679 [Rozella allomycis CSF55]|uniref:Uncharacterized protein n=1 Tax=Rozella allomycis (strain CSF55) TaxID=988480 RepID=A0A075B0I7_ROZAC|nr:hypothetical protein O9G_002679 [Rozella allomycis CSF55]|eukprot:EPZ36036.1 hypothetical protein O9G_002679 [Rozella allomycis CSF55]
MYTLFMIFAKFITRAMTKLSPEVCGSMKIYNFEEKVMLNTVYIRVWVFPNAISIWCGTNSAFSNLCASVPVRMSPIPPSIPLLSCSDKCQSLAQRLALRLNIPVFVSFENMDGLNDIELMSKAEKSIFNYVKEIMRNDIEEPIH